MTNKANQPVVPPTEATARSGRAISSRIAEKTTVSPSGGPSSDDCYTTLLHNPDHDLGSSSGKPSGKQPGEHRGRDVLCVRYAACHDAIMNVRDRLIGVWAKFEPFDPTPSHPMDDWVRDTGIGIWPVSPTP